MGWTQGTEHLHNNNLLKNKSENRKIQRRKLEGNTQTDRYSALSNVSKLCDYILFAISCNVSGTMGQDQSQNRQGSESRNSSFERSLQEATANPVPKQKAKLEDIVVVKDVPDAPQDRVDQTIAKLRQLRIMYPIIKNVAGVPIEGMDLIPGLNADPVTEMLLRYQYHLSECAEAVAFDQNALSKRLKEMELFSTSVLKTAIDRQKQMDQSLGIIQKFFEIDSLLDRIGKNMDKTIELMQNLNSLLPENDRFSPEELDVRSQSKNLRLN